MCACLAWDLVTLALFGLKILWLSKKNRYLLEVPGGDAKTTNFLFLDTTAAGKGLLIFETKHKGELFIKQFANQFSQLENVVLTKVSLSNINSLLDAEDFKGYIEFDGKEINFFPFDNEV